jgi:iron complex outermembrane recepter protein
MPRREVMRVRAQLLQATSVAVYSCGLVCAAPALADAQPSSSSPSSGSSQSNESANVSILEEIIVTAQKRKQRLLDVPMSITALTGDALARQGATTLLDVASTVPGLSTLEYAPGQNRAQLRGISSAAGAPTIGLYLDELPINVDSVQLGADVRFIDLERIEVLRGPQGTLYGEGSMGGTIKYVTRSPDLTKSSLGFDTAFGSVADGSELYRANVIVNVPVVADTFGVRFAGGYEQSPGWIDYPLIGAKDVNEGRSKTARLKSLWQVSDALKASLLLAYQDGDYDSQAFADARRTAPYLVLQPSKDENRLANLVLEYDAGPFTVLSSTGYLDRDVATRSDVTGFFAPIYTTPPPFGFGLPPGSVATVTLDGVSNFKATSEELRVASNGATRLTWTAGVYYRDYEDSADSSSKTTPNPLPMEVLTGQLERTSEQFAAFGEVGYKVTPVFETTVGLRYFRDERSKRGSGSNFGLPAPEPYGKETFTSVNPRLVLTYRPTEDQLFYVSGAQGFRSGGFNLLATRPPGCNLPDAFDPENLWTYEIGSNLTFSDGRVVVQGAVYRNDWKDIQVSEFCPGGQSTQTTNAGKASGSGVDLQLTLRPLDSLSIMLAGGYNDSQYDETSVTHNEGDSIDFVPKFSASISGDYSFQWAASLPGQFHLDYQYVDDFSISLRNFPGSQPIANSDGYGRLNARLSILSGAWELALFGQNLADTNKVVMPPIGVLLVPVSMQPRTIGIGLRYNY